MFVRFDLYLMMILIFIGKLNVINGVIEFVARQKRQAAEQAEKDYNQKRAATQGSPGNGEADGGDRGRQGSMTQAGNFTIGNYTQKYATFISGDQGNKYKRGAGNKRIQFYNSARKGTSIASATTRNKPVQQTPQASTPGSFFH